MLAYSLLLLSIFLSRLYLEYSLPFHRSIMLAFGSEYVLTVMVTLHILICADSYVYIAHINMC